MFIVAAVDMAKARGFKVQCYVPGLAASMAFQILAHCSERYALPHAYLMWHPVRAQIRGALTSTEARILANDLAETETMLVADLRSYLKVTDSCFEQHYVSAWIWSPRRF
jgi:ATP-dependent protease ClpP protease subunit